ncbi:MAG: hypothetical protein QOJ40_1781 [Verrucomicrobiota bacterium]
MMGISKQHQQDPKRVGQINRYLKRMGQLQDLTKKNQARLEKAKDQSPSRTARWRKR